MRALERASVRARAQRLCVRPSVRVSLVVSNLVLLSVLAVCAFV
jgi:hypothetical protein